MTSRMLHGDCLTLLPTLPDASVDLIVTSPPYADARKQQYGGPPPDEYVEWFLPIATELKRVLKPEGTFILNIKEKVVNGRRHRYVHHLIDHMEDDQGWLWTEEWMWHKKNCSPGKWPNRFRDAWEHIHQFNLQRRFNMYQDEVRVPIGDWSKSRLANLSGVDKVRTPSQSGSPFAKKVDNWIGRDTVYPTNVLHLATECGPTQHSATFPEELPEFFIKLFTRPGDLVLDPFAGSGTTGVVAARLGRDFIGIDIQENNIKLAEKRISDLEDVFSIVGGGS